MPLIFGLFGLKEWWDWPVSNLTRYLLMKTIWINICNLIQHLKTSKRSDVPLSKISRHFILKTTWINMGSVTQQQLLLLVPTNFSCLSAMCKACYNNGHLTVHEPEQQISKLLCLFLSSYQSHQSKAKRSLTWPLYGLFGLENPIISNGVNKKLAISNFNQIALVVPKLGAILENSSFYWGSTHSVSFFYLKTLVFKHLLI